MVRRVVFILLAIFLPCLQTIPGYAISDEQRTLLRENINYFDIDTCTTAPTSDQTSTAIDGSVYMLGDSITVRAKDDLDAAFQAKNAQDYINASVSRSITKPGVTDGFKTSGLDAVDGDKDRIKNAGTVIVALGTNQRDADFEASIKNLVNKIKSINPNANIYWVDVFSQGSSPNLVDRGSINSSIKSLADSLGYTVIDTVGKGIQVDKTDNVHETLGGGTKKFADVVVSGLGSGSDTSNDGSTKVPDSFTLRDRVGQLMFVGVSDPGQAASLEKKYNIGGFLLNSGVSDKAAVDAITGAGSVKPFVAVDEEGGQVQRINSGLPSAKKMGSMSADTVKKLASEAGKKMVGLGITVDFAPVLDLDNGKNNGAISRFDRSFGSNPSNVTEKAGAFADGLKSVGVIPTFKHFPGLGSANTNTDNASATVDSLSNLKQNDLKPYDSLISGTDALVMMGNQIVPGLTNGDPASMSKAAYQLLRGDYGFDGVIVTDEIGHAGAIKSSASQAVITALKSGADMPLFNADSEDQVSSVVNSVVAAVNNGILDRSQINKSLDRVLLQKKTDTHPAVNPAAQTCKCATDGISVAGNSHQEQAFNFFVTTMGYSKEQAAGAVGSLMFESTAQLNPTIPNGQGSGAYGVAQWLGSRLTDLQKFGGSDYNKFDTQIAFIKHELEGGYQSVNAAMKKATSYQAAQEEWTKYYEGLANNSDQWHFDERNKNALHVLTTYGSGGGSADAVTSDSSSCSSSGDGSGTISGNYSFPVAKRFYDQHPDWFTQPHHLHSDGTPDIAVDIPVPSGTSVYSISSGKIIAAPNEGGFGEGVTVDAGNGVVFIYGHGSDGGAVSGAKKGDTVKAGQLIMHSDNTGFSTGPHLHITIQVNGVNHCPQTFLVGIIKGSVPDPKSLPTTGCSGGSRI